MTKMDRRTFFAGLGAGIGIAGLATQWRPSSHSQNTSHKQSVYDRVLKSGKIRCGYGYWPGQLERDPITGKMKGVFADLMTEIGKRLDLEIEWAEEVDWSLVTESLKADRFDMFCVGLWPESGRDKFIDFSSPLYYSGIGAYVRADDKRFKTLDDLNREEVTVATVDAELSEILAKEKFPKAKRLSLPQMTEITTALLNVVYKKADVVFTEDAVFRKFIRANPGTLRQLSADMLRVYPNNLAFQRGQYEFKNMMDTVLEELTNHGVIENLLQKYEDIPGAYMRVAKPYQE